MKAIEFKEQTVVIAKDQPQYIPLSAHITKDGVVISCYKFSFVDKIRVLFGAKLWLSQMTFHSPLQPQRADLVSPFEDPLK